MPFRGCRDQTLPILEHELRQLMPQEAAFGRLWRHHRKLVQTQHCGRLKPPQDVGHLSHVKLHIQFICEDPLHLPILKRLEALSEAFPLNELHVAPNGRVVSRHVIVVADVSSGEVAQRIDAGGLEIRGGELRGDDTREDGEDDDGGEHPHHAHQPPPPGARDFVAVADRRNRRCGPPESVVDAVEVLAGEVAGVRFVLEEPDKVRGHTH
mmetsp:Transcript_61860/g.195466  ORF Transcript_61860/g.195466 Transcript_61860/m.195466 type:complete len:210 (-) Transcript_61860:945-1574(-)